MNTILPLIAQLHSPFMLERHWRRLETKIVKKAIPFKSDKFCLADLIQLELFKVGEDVSELVDSAQKEDKINKKLDGIKAIWEDQIFSFNSGEDGIPLLTSLDQITEYVDTHSLDLMGMQSSKDVEEFREEVTKWVKTLKTVDTVIGKWIKVQKDYLKLQPIFLQSDDIRNSLPDETKRFEKVDQDFQQLMRDAQDEPKVTECAGAEGREALLNELMNEINSCEKALNEYLEAKKKMFPRFYFIPNASLLEILSNGNNPRRVDDFLGDCFDGMRSMNLRP
jgi:dynein heavy chain